MDPKDVARDSSGTRACSQFLVELSERIPAIVLSNISVILCYLEQEVSFNTVGEFILFFEESEFTYTKFVKRSVDWTVFECSFNSLQADPN